MRNLLEYTRRPDITVYRSSGRIIISANVARMLSLRPGSTINIAHDNGEYLLFATHHNYPVGRHIAKCHPTKRGSNTYCANSVGLCRALLSVVNSTSDKVAFRVGEAITINGSLHLPIITKSPDIKI